MIENLTTTGIPWLDSLGGTIGTLTSYVQFLLGGVIGVYIFIFLFRIYDNRKQRKILDQIQADLKSLKAAMKRIESNQKKDYKVKLNELIDSIPVKKKKK